MTRKVLLSKNKGVVKFGYADESGEPGASKNERDYFVFCIVLVDSLTESLKISEKMKLLRQKLGLPETHEFHYATDSKRTRAAVMRFIRGLNFSFVSISIKKAASRQVASYVNMADYVVAIRARYLKRATNAGTVEAYKNIRDKLLVAIER